MKRTYMIAVQITVRPVVYCEVIAENAQDAVEKVKDGVHLFVEANMKHFKSEILTDLEGKEYAGPKVISCGRSDQYHSEDECKLCKSVSQL